MPDIALLLDSGGVLLCPDGELIAKHAASFGIEVTPYDAVRSMALADRDIDLTPEEAQGSFAATWAHYVGCAAETAEDLWRYLESDIPPTELWGEVNPEAIRLFAELPPNVRRYVVSNADGRAHAELVYHGLSDHVEGVLDSGAVGVAKPDRRIFAMAAVALATPMTHCIYVGDTLGGAAEEHHPRTVLYDRFDVFADHSPENYQRIRNLAELIPLLAEVVQTSDRLTLSPEENALWPSSI